jgi:hypothetical protein
MAQDNRKVLHEAVATRRGTFQKVFATENGKKLLQILKEDFQGSAIFHTDPQEMAKRAAQHDLVTYIEDMARMNDE